MDMAADIYYPGEDGQRQKATGDERGRRNCSPTAAEEYRPWGEAEKTMAFERKSLTQARAHCATTD